MYFSQPPPDPTPLECLAYDAGLGANELREYLRRQIDERLAAAMRVVSFGDDGYTAGTARRLRRGATVC